MLNSKSRLLLWGVVYALFFMVFGCEDNSELLDKLTTENGQLQSDLTQLTVGISGIEANLKQLELERDGLKKELGLLQGNNVEVEKERDDLSKGLVVLQEDHDKAVSKRDELKKEIVELDQKIDDVRKIILRLEEKAALQKEEIDELISQLQDKDIRMRSVAAQALGSLGENAKDAVPALIESLQPGVATNILTNSKSGTHTLLDNRLDAAWALGQIGLQAENAVPVILEILSNASNQDGSGLSSEEKISCYGVLASSLVSIGSDTAIDGLTKVLVESGKRVDTVTSDQAYIAIITALVQVRKEKLKDVMPILIREWRGKNVKVFGPGFYSRQIQRMFSFNASVPDKDVAPYLIELLDDPDQKFVSEVVVVLKNISKRFPEVHEMTVNALLGQFPERGLFVTDTLGTMTNNPDDFPIDDAAKNANFTIMALIQVLNNPDIKIRSSAIRSLGLAGSQWNGFDKRTPDLVPDLINAVPILIKILKEDINILARFEAASALGLIGERTVRSDAAVPIMVEILNLPEPSKNEGFSKKEWARLRSLIAQGLGRIGAYKTKEPGLIAANAAILALIEISKNRELLHPVDGYNIAKSVAVALRSISNRTVNRKAAQDASRKLFQAGWFNGNDPNAPGSDGIVSLE